MYKILILFFICLLGASCTTKPESVDKIHHPEVYFQHHDMKKIAEGVYVSERHKDIMVFSDAITSFELLTPDFKRPPELAGIDHNREETRVELRLELLHSGTMELSFHAPHYRFGIPKDLKQVYIEKRNGKIHAICVPQLGGLGKLMMGPNKKWIQERELKKRSGFVSEMVFGKARIEIGMTKAEVLKQIELSRSQYNPLESEQSTELYIQQPNAETIEKNHWLLVCPSRNSRFLGGGGGINYCIHFENGKVKLIDKLWWRGG
jgi:hypothetical protein